MEKYIITGATGHVGYNFMKKLTEQTKEKIKLLVLDGEDTSLFDGMNVEIKFGNVLDKKHLEREIEKDSIVFHFAGIIDIACDKESRAHLYNVNINGTKNVADVCLKNKVKRLIYTSSVHAIDPEKNNKLLIEPLTFDAGCVIGDYAKSKTEATGYIFDLTKKGLDAVVVYPSGVIGPNDVKVSNIGQMILDLANKKINVSITGGYNFVDARDLAEGLIGASKKGRAGEGYLLSGNMVSIEELFSYVNIRFGRTKASPKVPMWLVKMAAPLLELIYKIKKQKPVITRYSLYTVTSNHNFSNKKAQKELGFKIRPAYQSVWDSVDWLVQNRRQLFSENALSDYVATHPDPKTKKPNNI